MNKIILFDIDYTLSDRDFLRNFGRNYLAMLVNKTVYDIDYMVEDIIAQSAKQFGIFDIYYYAKEVAERFNKADLNKKLIDMFLKYYPVDKALYKETKEVLDTLKNKYILGIQSDGQPIFQLKKVENIKKYFNDKYIFIFKNKREEIFDKIQDIKNNIIVLDDKPDYIEKLLENGVRAIHINRGPYAIKKDEYKIKESIDSLNGLLPLLM